MPNKYLLNSLFLGETLGSYIASGAVEFLLGVSEEAMLLRQKYVFKIVPILNPDGEHITLVL